jgi:hypothetical protein
MSGLGLLRFMILRVKFPVFHLQRMQHINHEVMSDNYQEDSLTHYPRDVGSSSLFHRPNPLPLTSVFNLLGDLEKTLDIMDPSSPTIQNLLHQLQEKMPYHPPLKIVSGAPFNWPIALLRIDRHLKTTFEDAVGNLGFQPSSNEESFLRKLIQHPCGWSATPSQHRNASAFRYINKLHPQLQNSLEPVLDNATWPEDAPYFPLGWEPGPPTFVLLISKSSPISRYYLLFDYTLYRAGNTLEEVFVGMRDSHYYWPCDENGYVQWEGEDPCSDSGNIEAYFPQYEHHPGHGNWCLAWQIPEPPDKIPTDGGDYPEEIPICK